MQVGLENFKEIKNSYKNYLKVIFALIVNKREIKVILKNNNMYTWSNLQVRNYIVAYNLRYSIDSEVEFFPETDKIEFNYMGKRLTFFGFLENGWIYYELVNFEYNKLNFKNRVVLDIGANSGATSIFFILNGAKYVYALEPMPKTYSLLKENIDINRLKEVICPLNYGIGEPSQINLNIDVSGQGANINSAITKSGKPVEIKTLASVIEKYNIENCVVKMDCEGCEYEALLSLDTNTMRHISEIILEYHYGYLNLKKFLEENGYNVKWTEPVKSYNNISKKKMKSGFLFAWKEMVAEPR